MLVVSTMNSATLVLVWYKAEIKSSACNFTVELGYNVMKGTEYFVSL
jgi:hypothetical protein